jgi:phosphatidylinositol-bisphosphatase
MVDKRNADFHDLSKRLTFDSGIAAYNGLGGGEGLSSVSIYESDILVWMVSEFDSNRL